MGLLEFYLTTPFASFRLKENFYKAIEHWVMFYGLECLTINKEFKGSTYEVIGK